MLLSLIDANSNQIAHFENKSRFRNRKYPFNVDVTLDMVFNFIFLAGILNNNDVQMELYFEDDPDYYLFDGNEFYVLDEETINTPFTGVVACKNSNDAKLIEEFISNYKALLVEWASKKEGDPRDGPAQTAFFGMFDRLRKIKSIRIHSAVDLIEGFFEDENEGLCEDCKAKACAKCGTMPCPDCGECHGCEIVKKIDLKPEMDPKKLN